MDNKNIKYYKVTKDSDVYAISLVDYPAIESNFVYLSKEQPKQIFLETNEKYMLYGAVLIPNFPIYRRDEFGEYYLIFDSDVIEKLSYDYMLNGRLESFTEQHEKDIYGDVSIVESWIKMSENDKSNDLGLNLPVGSWVIGAKIHNTDLWSKIKNGEVNGFSIESIVSVSEIEKLRSEKIEPKMIDEETFLSKVQNMIEQALSNFNKKEEEVVEENVELEHVEETEEKVVEEVKEEEVELEKVEETVVDNEKVEMENTIKSLQEELNSLKTELNTLKEENVKLSKQPSIDPVSTTTEKNNNLNRFDAVLDILNGNAFKK